MWEILQISGYIFGGCIAFMICEPRAVNTRAIADNLGVISLNIFQVVCVRSKRNWSNMKLWLVYILYTSIYVPLFFFPWHDGHSIPYCYAFLVQLADVMLLWILPRCDRHSTPSCHVSPVKCQGVMLSYILPWMDGHNITS